MLTSSDPKILQERKEVEEAAIKNFRKPFLDGLHGIPTDAKPDQIWKVKVIVTFVALVTLAVLASIYLK